MKKAWYKQFWPWFLIALPASAVIGSLTTVSIFAKNKVSLVAEDYYKKGKAVNLDLSRIELAQQSGINALLTFENQQGEILFNQGELAVLPSLRITFSHRTLPDQDFDLLITPDASGIYRFNTTAVINGPWFIEVEPFDRSWLLSKKVTLPIQGAWLLEGN
ncbi:FixH family protein [Thaumasiovibrio sp. DFM-14]|uniref:FixH family protein n=1 Tax=Thaumasiovibrio sp. DFM-14 TaxID=3384792 RepID=UPI0039A2C805